MTYSMTCSCGDTFSVEAESREEAVRKMKDMMTQEAIDQHMSEKHPKEPGKTMAGVHAEIDQKLQPM